MALTQKLLTIAIPTYNRALYLKEGLCKVLEQIKGLEDKVEILVSNNCSTDSTEQVVLDFIAQGAPISYNCNKSNLGMDGNFVYCFTNASAKYVWILGDDDYLVDDTISRLIDILQNGEYGLVHLNTSVVEDKGVEVFEDKIKYAGEISYWITFISANIVNTKYVDKIDFDKYLGSYFTLIPVYLSAALNEKQNVMVRFQTMETAKNFETNGGYNVFKVFVINYLRIIKEFRPQLSIIWYEIEKQRLFKHVVQYWVNRLILTKNSGLNYSTTKWRYIIWSRYWYEPYLYPMILKSWIVKLLYKYR